MRPGEEQHGRERRTRGPGLVPGPVGDRRRALLRRCRLGPHDRAVDGDPGVPVDRPDPGGRRAGLGAGVGCAGCRPVRGHVAAAPHRSRRSRHGGARGWYPDPWACGRATGTGTARSGPVTSAVCRSAAGRGPRLERRAGRRPLGQGRPRVGRSGARGQHDRGRVPVALDRRPLGRDHLAGQRRPDQQQQHRGDRRASSPVARAARRRRPLPDLVPPVRGARRDRPGCHARREPVLATLSFIIPILNLWWPYQSTCDLLPADHPGRLVVRRWWALWIGCTIGGRRDHRRRDVVERRSRSRSRRAIGRGAGVARCGRGA